MTMTPMRTAGYYRGASSADWAAAAFNLAPGYLDVMPADATSASVVPVERVPLTQVTGLAEVAPAYDGVMTVRANLGDGRTFEAALPEDFVGSLCDALEASAAPPPPVGSPGAPANMDSATMVVPVPVPVPLGSPLAPPLAPPTVAQSTVPATAVPATPQAWASPVVAPASPAAPGTTEQSATNTRNTRKMLWAALATALILSLLVTSIIFWQHGKQETVRANTAEAELARTSAELAATKKSLDDTKAELAKSTTDNTDLTTRVSELGNEKAQVQDERNAAEELARLGAKAAQEMVDCRDRLVDVISYVADEFYATAASALDAATPICQSANSAIQAFQSAAGS